MSIKSVETKKFNVGDHILFNPMTEDGYDAIGIYGNKPLIVIGTTHGKLLVKEHVEKTVFGCIPNILDNFFSANCFKTP